MAFGSDNWRCGKSGLVLLPNHVSRNERLNLKPAESVFVAWLQARKWEVELSDKGYIARQMLKQLGGKFGVQLLAKEGTLGWRTQSLWDCSGDHVLGGRISNQILRNLHDERNVPLFLNPNGIPAQSPRLPRSGYLGLSSHKPIQPQRGCGQFI